MALSDSSAGLIAVPPSELRRWWGPVRIDVVGCMAEDQTDALLEDVYCELKEGRAHLYVYLDEGKYTGMVILQAHRDPFSGRPSLHIWYARGHQFESGIKGLAEIATIARSIDAEYISYKCQKESVRKWGEARGFELAEMEMRRYGLAQAIDTDDD